LGHSPLTKNESSNFRIFGQKSVQITRDKETCIMRRPANFVKDDEVKKDGMRMVR
jgi:hypothetical protein